MENLKSETIKIVTPVGTRFRYSYLVTPDEYLGVEKWKTEALIPVGSKIKNEQGELVEATVFIVEKLEALLEGWKAQLKAAFPNKKFTLVLRSRLRLQSFVLRSSLVLLFQSRLLLLLAKVLCHENKY